MNEFYTATDHFVLLPALMLALFGCAVLLFEFLLPGRVQQRWLVALTFAGLLLTGLALFRQQTFLVANNLRELSAFHGSLVIDRFALFFNWMFLAASAIVAMISWRFLEDDKQKLGEYYGLMLLANCGMFFLAAGTDLITIIVGLELMALCFYILVGFLRSDKRSNEAAMKYLLLGSFSTGFLLYGFSLLYGLSGSTKLNEISAAVTALGPGNPIVFMAIVACAVGLLFKISAAPFHMWAPDAYEGAPTPVTAYLAVASKAASFALLTRIFLGPLSSARPTWEPLLMVIAILTLTIGNLAALSQENVKRMLAYSSISHAGYILLGLVAGNDTGMQGIAVYILVYAFMTLGAFLVVAAMHREGVPGDTIADLRGLIRRKPGYAVWMLIFMMSLAGLPPTAGFLGKYFIFVSLIETGHTVAAAIAALFSVVALYYYFRIVKSMFQGDEVEADDPAPVRSLSFTTALAITGVLTVVIGIYPEPFLRFAHILPPTASANASVVTQPEAR
ncbi:MAG: NADH-quinone oxidoreductase subunit N [Bryobacteraceae bacterium]|nr:NADH-quinone oxidoreductase subunit N [Bryobacteraceae bacterium]